MPDASSPPAQSPPRHPAPPTLIRGGRVIDPASGTDAVLDVALDAGIIAAIGPKLPTAPAARVIDAAGLLVVPGLIDPHVHLREPGQTHKGDIATETRAAASGGFTSVVCMPNTTPALDTPEMVEFIRARAAQTASCRVFVAAAGTQGRKGERPAEHALCARAGAVCFTDDGDGIADAGVMLAVLRSVHQTGRAFCQHAQDHTLTRAAAMHAGEVSIRLGLGGWPRVAEEVMVERDVRLNTGIGCRYHVQHVSSAGTVEIIRRARAAGQPVSGEASPHHLLLTHDVVASGPSGFNTMTKMNPPLRERDDVAALVQGVADGTITILATDHAPHTDAEKAQPFEDAPFGIIGLESALPLYAEALVTSGAITWPRLIALLTIEPARLCGLDTLGLGKLAVGGPADVTLIDPERRWSLTRSDLAGRCANTPFVEGQAAARELVGRAVATLCGGHILAGR
jgi:dihydroorotase